jgi:hypothetical protein
MRLLLRSAVIAASALVFWVPHARAYGWPIAPFDVQHPIRGYFGDPRIEGRARSFHSGVDIAAPVGTPVYPVMSGIAYVERPMVVDVVGAREFTYWHIVPSVRSGQWVTAYRTVLGHITARWLHVHFMEWDGGVPVNPVRPGGLEPYVDRTRPTIDRLVLERNGSEIDTAAVAGRISIILDAHDEPALSAPPPWADLPVAPVLIRWRITSGGNLVRNWQTAVDFRGALPPAWEFDHVYARGTYDNGPNEPGRYRFYLVHDWDANQLRPDDYELEVAVSDTAGNTATQSFPFSVIDWLPIATPPPARRRLTGTSRMAGFRTACGRRASGSSCRQVLAARAETLRPAQGAVL